MSVFSSIPAESKIASNELAFAIRDKFPVSDGHTLVIPNREITTWWDATLQERDALFVLVDVVRAQLLESHEPEGFNVGFNAGEVAGQTVDHLHIHVIPRYRGDMADPRGGVRHVIPERGNYLGTGLEDSNCLPKQISCALADRVYTKTHGSSTECFD
jgi:diadenosine tetraphosphate (Ap4A) HIT family hydrolase